MAAVQARVSSRGVSCSSGVVFDTLFVKCVYSNVGFDGTARLDGPAKLDANATPRYTSVTTYLVSYKRESA